MQLKERVRRNWHAEPEYKFRAAVSVRGDGLGLVDAAGPTERIALLKAYRRYRLCWLGVEWPGLCTPPEALQLHAGQVAWNGHRLALWRVLSPGTERLIHWIMLNPSTASAERDDPTLRRVCDYSKRWGFGWVTVGNLWSYRATEPAKLKKWLSSGGEWVTRASADNYRWLTSMARRAELVVVAWGNHGAMDNRGLATLRFLSQLGMEPYALGVTRQGEPRHPLYQSKDLQPRPLDEIPLYQSKDLQPRPLDEIRADQEETR